MTLESVLNFHHGALGIEFKSLGFREGIYPMSHFTSSRCMDSYIVPGLHVGN